MFIFKYWTILFLLVIFSFNCSLKKEEDDSDFSEISITKEKHDFHLDFKPNLALLFENYLLVIGENLLYSNNIAAINSQTNKIDSVFSTKIDKRGLSNYLMKNDTLIAYNKVVDKWEFWDEEWVEYDIIYKTFFNNLVNNNRFNLLKFLAEDAKYFITCIDVGEFGACINFQDKETQCNFVLTMKSPNLVLKIDGEYYINGNLPHMDGFVQVVKFKDPCNFIELPDSLNYIVQDNVDGYWDFIDSCENMLLPDSLRFSKESEQSYKYHEQIRSILKEEKQENYKYTNLLDTMWLLNYGVFNIDENLGCFYVDSGLNLGVINKSKIIKIEKLYEDNLFSYYSHNQVYNGKWMFSSSFWKMKLRKQKMTCLIYENKILKRYDFY